MQSFGRLILALGLLPLTAGAAAPVYVWKPEGQFTACHRVMDSVSGQGTMLVPDTNCKKPPTAFSLQRLGNVNECAEVDVATFGERVRLRAPMEKCAKGETTFRWERPALLSECWEVDAAEDGRRFRQPAPSAKCPKPPTRFEEHREILETGCFEVDKATGGKQFIAEAALSACPNGLNPNFWAETPGASRNTDSRINRDWLPKTNYQRIKTWILGDKEERNAADAR